MKQPDVSHEYIRSVMQLERKNRRKKQLALTLGLTGVAIVCLALLITRQTVRTPLKATPVFYRLSIDEASPERVRQLLQAGQFVVIDSPEKHDRPDTISKMAEYFSFFRDRYFEGDKVDTLQKKVN